MPTTRSAAKALSILVSGTKNAAAAKTPQSPSKNPQSKRKISEQKVKDSDAANIVQDDFTQHVKKRRVDTTPPVVLAAAAGLQPPPLVTPALQEAAQLLPAVLTFSFDSAKQHLVKSDPRFADMFEKIPCRPFEHLEKIDPFRTLVTSILGQQISWLAARSITHRFIRLYHPELPEKVAPVGSNDPKVPDGLFPSASQVAETDLLTLKSAGLSTRKAEYVKDLASRFADGRLSSQKLAEADDEELASLLIQVRGIGRWTVDMFAIFSLRRPDILPIGDLGVQRGLLRWVLSLHSPDDPYVISPKKLPKPPTAGDDDMSSSPSKRGAVAEPLSSINIVTATADTADISSRNVPVVPATPKKTNGGLITTSNNDINLSSPDKAENIDDDIGGGSSSMPGLFPEPLTPSVNKILNNRNSKRVAITDVEGKSASAAPSLPEGLSVAILKARLSGKKIKGCFLTPKEMEDLTEPWRPYRSLGVYYMWALAEEPAAKSSSK